MATSYEQRRAEAVIAGKADLPEGKIERLSEKQQAFYLSLRGSFRESLKIALVWHEERINKAFGESVALGHHLSAGRIGAEGIMADFDALAPCDVMQMRIDSVVGLLLCQRGGLARVCTDLGNGQMKMENQR